MRFGTVALMPLTPLLPLGGEGALFAPLALRLDPLLVAADPVGPDAITPASEPAGAATALFGSALARVASLPALALVGALVVLASGFAQGSTLASFTRTTANAANQFTAATINLTAAPRQTAGGSDNSAGNDIFSGTSSSTVTLSGVIAGDTWTRYVTLANTGDVAASFTLSTTATGTAALTDGGAKSLLLSIRECTDNTFGSCSTSLYNTPSSPGSPIVTNQTIKNSVAANGKEYLEISLTLPSSVTDDGTGSTIQGGSTTITFTWKATQLSGATR